MNAVNEWTGGNAKTKGRILNSFIRRGLELAVLGDSSSQLKEKILNRLKGDENILDVGAGSGYYSLQIAAKLTTGRIYCLDGSPDMLAILKRLADRRGLSEKIVHINADADLSGLGNSTMDIAASFNLFHELSDPSPVFAEMIRVLKPGGIIVISDFSKEFADKHAGAFGGWSRKELEIIMRTSGFENVSVAVVKKTIFATGRKL